MTMIYSYSWLYHTFLTNKKSKNLKKKKKKKKNK